MDSIGERIKYYRKERGLTQNELAEKTNLSRSHIASIERNIYTPSISTLTEIANALNIDLSILISENKTPDYKKNQKRPHSSSRHRPSRYSNRSCAGYIRL